MVRDTLEMMARMMNEALLERTTFRNLWYREWFDLFLRAYESGRKVVYTSLYAFPMEILAAFNVAPFDFEIAGGLMSSMDQGLPLMTEAEGRGYSADVCSFHRAGLGGFFKGWFPRPDLLITTSFYCEGKGKANDVASLVTGADTFYLDVPREISVESVGYVARQLEDAARKVGEVAGQGLDMERLKDAVRSSNRSRRLQLEILDLLKERPMPMNPRDMIAYSINGQLFCGSPVKERLEEQLIREIGEKRARGTARPERHRIFWFAWTPTHRTEVFDILRDHRVGIPLCETFRVHWDEIDEDRPFEGLALKCLRNPFVGPAARRLEGMEDVVGAYGIDGGLLFATPACRHSHNAHMLLKDAFSRLGKPFLKLDLDISDPRGYQPEQVRTRLEAFIEVMDRGELRPGHGSVSPENMV
ncbi:MAG TPA: 2-hydroxyacyl-CoA dehydratase family protein [Deltaproteobacteria bacterium]|nr:2-hydroxyacyl-CoA dehydratase family protein [Deltaproteobacteria bacterium]HPR53798.1 2-hydroxyacyl-CoA dehydratase family protein [Deltaproteobacteria bacterium]HXK46002.1 2-hydroxyacyl-CoA dehydratase family protein [Deltaproteobacteria bacterium]